MARHRRSGPSGADTEDEGLRGLRGVHEEPYLKNGKRCFVAVDSRGWHVAERLLSRDAPEWRVKQVMQELWDELDAEDPIAPHDRPPSFPPLRLA